MNGQLSEQPLAELIRESLGDPAFYRASVDKTALPEAATALGVPFPAFTIASTLADATRFALFETYDLDDANRVTYRETGERFGISETAVTNGASPRVRACSEM